jgi:serine/threonine-protein kinase
MPEQGGKARNSGVTTRSPIVAVRDESDRAKDPLLGKVLDGRYQIENVLGEGGMGIVYRAVHTTLGKQLAIKVLRPEVSKKEEILARFKQEARSASAIGNQHIIDISDFGVLPDGSTYFVMEFLGGKSLTEALQDGKFETSRTIRVARQLCNALGAAHEIGVVHRDLKPDNVQLIERDNNSDFVKVLDFGIAKVGGASSKLTQAGQVFGTPHYMSPEQCAGTAVDNRTDIYAIGVMMYEMATGQVPFDADNLMGILTKHMYENPIPPRDFDPPTDVPPALEAVIMKALAKKPEGRYQNMAEMAADLQAAEAGTTPRAVVEAVDRSAGMGAPTEAGRTGVTVGVPDQEVRIKKSQAPLFIAVGVVVLLAGGAAAFVFAGSGSDAEVEADQNVIAPAPVEKPAAAADKGEKPAEPDEKSPPPVVEKPRITITTAPEEVEVYLKGMLVGNTPYQLDKPGKGEVVELEFRKAGYKDKQVKFSSMTSKRMKVTLAKAEAKKRRSTGSKRAKPKKTTSSGPSWPGSGDRPGRTEVLDPWD